MGMIFLLFSSDYEELMSRTRTGCNASCRMTLWRGVHTFSLLASFVSSTSHQRSVHVFPRIHSLNLFLPTS